jgi:hypothetical protein
MDVIILAAGENVRLHAAGLAPGLKPLIVVNNEVLIRRLCRQVCDVWSTATIVIVVSPTNANEIVFATHDYLPQYVVQPKAVGPCEAVDRALRLELSPTVCLLMGDNFIKNFAPPPIIHPAVTVTYELDANLHPLMDGSFITPVNGMDVGDARWLGPLAFNTNMWCSHQQTWVQAFAKHRFQYIEASGIQDMGVLT